MSTRRSFIKKSAATLGAPLILSKPTVFSLLEATPSDQLNVGVIGTGSRGQGLMRILNQIEGINLMAICDTLSFRLEEATAIAPKAFNTLCRPGIPS